MNETVKDCVNRATIAAHNGETTKALLLICEALIWFAPEQEEWSNPPPKVGDVLRKLKFQVEKSLTSGELISFSRDLMTFHIGDFEIRRRK